MHFRRALLLFTIVLGLAALAATVSRPRDERSRDPLSSPPPPAEREPTSASPGSGPASRELAELDFQAELDQTRRLAVGRPATLEVEVDEPGQVEIPVLGLGAPADALTPARFEVIPSEVRRYAIRFTPAASDEESPAGTLAVTPVEK